MPACERTLAVLFALGVMSCGNVSAPPPDSSKTGPRGGEAAVDKPFVAFKEPSVSIDRLELPVAAAVAPGSSPSPATMVSDTPDVVSIQADGTLVAHRNGRATIRALQGGGSLTVEVIAASGMRAEPRTLRVGPGTAALPVLMSGDATVPAGAASWFSNAPDVAMVEDGRIRAGPSKGTATLTAVYGGERVQVTVDVGNRDTRRK